MGKFSEMLEKLILYLEKNNKFKENLNNYFNDFS